MKLSPPLDKAERSVVRAAMGWLRWMEKNRRAQSWLDTYKKWPDDPDNAVPKLLIATDKLRKARKK